jgi:hypothetical protein
VRDDSRSGGRTESTPRACSGLRLARSKGSPNRSESPDPSVLNRDVVVLLWKSGCVVAREVLPADAANLPPIILIAPAQEGDRCRCTISVASQD